MSEEEGDTLASITRYLAELSVSRTKTPTLPNIRDKILDLTQRLEFVMGDHVLPRYVGMEKLIH
jgi:hypothetical protein